MPLRGELILSHSP
uniref:Uncharacterized protein n=1 Tax=Arundo donax TaxID=35708 RepID=A0A0A9A4R4_ARUDO